jgi:class 3 adenylate cyclase
MNEHHLRELRLLLEELCCDLCRFEHLSHDGISPEHVLVDREFNLGVPGAFADIRVHPAGKRPYCIEVDYGYPRQTMLQSLKRKYMLNIPRVKELAKVIVVVDAEERRDWEQLQQQLAGSFPPDLSFEVWNEERLMALIQSVFGVRINSMTAGNLLNVRDAINRAKGFLAFGGRSPEDHANTPLQASLLWHFTFWRLAEIRKQGGLADREILPPGPYRGAVVVTADISGFSGYVRDTRDDGILRRHLTSFYSKSRSQVIESGGMMYQIVGDEIVAVFGVPDRRAGYIVDALRAATSLLNVGLSVTRSWQRQLDRCQPAEGVHIGIAIGDIQLVSLRPFSRTHMGIVGDTINVAARLMSAAAPGEIIVSNWLHHEIGDASGYQFSELEPIDARNIGRIKAWRLQIPAPPSID